MSGPGCGVTGCHDAITITLFVSVEVAALTAPGFEVCIEGACSNLGPRTPDSNPDLTQFDHGAPLAGGLMGEARLRSLSPGTLVLLRIRPTPELLVDGARFRLRVNSTTPYVLERFVTYFPTYNTPGCEPPTCRNAALRLFPSSKTGLRCTAKACQTGIEIQTKIARAPSSIDFSTVRFCRNGVCSTDTLVGGAGTERGVVGSAAMFGRIPCSYFHSGDASSLILRFISNEDGYLLRDGDRYTIDVIDQMGGVIHHEEHVADYVETFPNGQECDTEPCRYVTIGR